MDINNVHDQMRSARYGSLAAAATHDQPIEGLDLRKGPWTAEEDSILNDYVNIHGEGRWNSLACHAGLKRTGKSCRLRWLNYLRPNVQRGNITLQEQLIILQLHSRWGNRWSKIAEYLPGRTDNEIKNYWRTRVQKQAKQLKCDVNSKQFQDAMRYVWIPRLIERIGSLPEAVPEQPSTCITTTSESECQYLVDPNFVPETSGSTSSESYDQVQVCSIPADPTSSGDEFMTYPSSGQYGSENGSGCSQNGINSDIHGFEQCNYWSTGGDTSVENLWTEENIWFLQQQLSDD
ncbi:hypothetical protein C1H46_034823 [Malus baccata]|uniref:Uncharacterized protein n=1 Tax=Malus baccata TaxID=106549 RepID=A0A540KZJ3_MALBA|nr:hypothetical protein C1H46_034823 [Malus baccata]